MSMSGLANEIIILEIGEALDMAGCEHQYFR